MQVQPAEYDRCRGGKAWTGVGLLGTMLLLGGQMALVGHHMAQFNSGSPPFTPFGTADSFLSDYTGPLAAQLALTGRVLQVTAEEVLVDVNYKSEGSVDLREWYDEATGQVVPPQPGDEVQLLLQAIEDESGAGVARLTRTWILTPGRYDVRLDQKIENLTQQPFTAQWVQTGRPTAPMVPMAPTGRGAALGWAGSLACSCSSCC